MGKPFPWRHACILAWCQFTSAFSFAVLFPFVPFMVVDLGLVDDPRGSGLYTGFLISASQLGKILTAYCWGSWSDTHGRKRVILVGLAGISLAMLAFGLAGSFKVACMARFLGGASDNIFGAAKTLLSESMEDEHQAKGMAMLGSAWGFAVIIGPAVGGLLSQPAVKYPWAFSSTGLFGVNPYLLPCCFTAGMAVLAALLLNFVPEMITVKGTQPKSSPPRADGEDIVLEESVGDERKGLLAEDGELEATSHECRSKQQTEQPPQADKLRQRRRHWVRERKPMLVVATCGVMNCFVVADDDVMPLWTAAPRDSGGLGMATEEIGLVLGAIGVLMLVCFTCFASLDKALGTLRAFELALLIFIPAELLTPVAGDFRSNQAMWAWVLGIGGVKGVAMEYVIIGMGEHAYTHIRAVETCCVASRRGMMLTSATAVRLQAC
jgi:MFS family permease